MHENNSNLYSLLRPVAMIVMTEKYANTPTKYRSSKKQQKYDETVKNIKISQDITSNFIIQGGPKNWHILYAL